MTNTTARRLASVVTMAALAILPGCGRHRGAADLGVHRLTLDLAFKDQSKAAKPAAPVPPQEQAFTISQIVGHQPLAPVANEALSIGAPLTRATPSLPFLSCKTSPEGALPDEPVSGVPKRPPDAGIYLQHNKGHFSLEGAFRLSGDFPPIGSMEIANVTDETTADETGALTRTVTYDVIVKSLLSSTTTQYRSITRDSARTFPMAPSAVTAELELLSSETKTTTDKITFKPSPPITIMQYGGEGDFWRSAGIDQDTKTSMTVDGKIAGREAVDVCGTMVDTYRVESNEQVVNVASNYQSGPTDGRPTVYNIATQFGGLIVRLHTDTTTRLTAAGAPATLIIDNVATIDTIKPIPKRS